MIARLSAITACLAAGHAVLSGLFWLLLAVPESNLAMLIASVLIVLLMITVFGWVEGLGVLAWHTTVPARELPRRVARLMPWVWLAGLVFLVVATLVSGLSGAWFRHRGEIDAWLMLHFNVTETNRIHALAQWVLLFVTYVLGVSLAVALVEGRVRDGATSAARATWLRAAVSPVRLILLTGIWLLFLWLPWRAVDWRPKGLAPNWQEVAFVAVKLGVLFLVANVGWALVLGLGRAQAVGFKAENPASKPAEP